MSSRKKPPLVAICGRPNVGKSTLYNRLVGLSSAIVHDEEGITRDRHVGAAEWHGRRFRVVDTGGIVEAPLDPIVRKMQEQVRLAIKEAAVVVFVADGRAPLTRVDYELRDELLKQGKPIVLAVNKLDNEQFEPLRHDFHELGLGEPIAISSTHGLGTDTLVDAILVHLPQAPLAPVESPDEADEAAAAGPDAPRVDDGIIKVAVVGRPNAGKSSFINALLGEERTIVDETPGTTRDAIDIDFRWKERDYLLIDTAGMRKKAGIKTPIEHFSVARSLRAIRRADVCLVLVDAQQGLGEQDLKIVEYASEQGIAMALLWTKWDLVENKEKRFAELKDQIDLKAPFLHHVPMITISSVARTRLFKVIELVDRLADAATRRVATGPLNSFLARIKDDHQPPAFRGKAPKILYMTQVSVKPTVFVMFVNQTKVFHFSYLRYIENRLREEYGFEGVPIRIELREGKPDS
jgi:GTP-binding protein